MFRSDEQLARACRALCALVGMGRLWTTEGPTERAREILEADGGPLSSGERLMLLAAWGVWNGSGDIKIGDAVHRLDGRALSALGSLMVAAAAGARALDDWLATMEGQPPGAAPGVKLASANASETAPASDGGHESASGDVMMEPAD